jgi:RTX calcium-binding nonapeptide repeat (4 copies)
MAGAQARARRSRDAPNHPLHPVPFAAVTATLGFEAAIASAAKVAVVNRARVYCRARDLLRRTGTRPAARRAAGGRVAGQAGGGLHPCPRRRRPDQGRPWRRSDRERPRCRSGVRRGRRRQGLRHQRDDVLRGGPGDDILADFSGWDRLYGGTGEDYIKTFELVPDGRPGDQQNAGSGPDYGSRASPDDVLVGCDENAK